MAPPAPFSSSWKVEVPTRRTASFVWSQKGGRQHRQTGSKDFDNIPRFLHQLLASWLHDPVNNSDGMAGLAVT